MKNSSILFIVIALLLFTSCEKKVNLSYKGNNSRIIIEGNITNEAGPYFVKITKSVNLTATETNPTIDDVLVTISDNAGNNETLTSLGKGMYRTAVLNGVEGRTYTLTVKTEGQTYTA